MIPFRRRPRPLFKRQAAHPAGGMRAIGGHRRAPDSKYIAVAGKVGVVLAVQDLHLECTREWNAEGRQGIAPDEQTGVAPGLDVPPFQLDHEVFIRSFGPQHTGGLSGRDDHRVAHGECFGATLTGTQPLKSLPLKRGLNSSSARTALDPIKVSTTTELIERKDDLFMAKLSATIEP